MTYSKTKGQYFAQLKLAPTRGGSPHPSLGVTLKKIGSFEDAVHAAFAFAHVVNANKLPHLPAAHGHAVPG